MKIVCYAWKELAHSQAGGSEQYVDVLVRNLIKIGHEVTLVAGGPVGTRDYTTVDAGGTYTQYLKVPISNFLANSYDLGIDVANGVAHCSPLWSRRPSILVWHHLHAEQWDRFFPFPIAKFGKFFERSVLPKIYQNSAVIVVSESSKAELLTIGFNPSQIFLIPNAVDQTKLDLKKADEPTYVALGRLVPQKRIGMLLDIWGSVRNQVGGTLQIIGEGPLRNELEQRRVPGVQFLGYVSNDEKSRLLAQAWLLLHSSEREGWGISITEAGMQRTPSVGFSVPGVKDSIINGQTGFLAQSPEEFARYWLDLRFDNELRNKFGLAAQSYASNFSEAISLQILGDALKFALNQS